RHQAPAAASWGQLGKLPVVGKGFGYVISSIGGELPGAFLGQQRARQLIVEVMTRLMGGIACNQRVANEIQITDSVENLVLDEFVVVAQAIGIQDTVFIKHDGVVKTTATGQAGRTQGLDLARK